MVDLPACPQCGQENTYADAALWICPDCGHEWNGEAAAEAGSVVRDSNGNRLAAGDTVDLTLTFEQAGTVTVPATVTDDIDDVVGRG